MSGPASRHSQLAAYADLFDRLTDCAFLLDPGSQLILDANPACERLLGIPVDRLRGHALIHWVSTEQRDDFTKALRVAMRRYHPRLFEATWRFPDLKALTIEIQACPVKLSDGSEVLQVLARDITYRRETELKMQQLLAKLEVLSTVDEMTGLFNFRQFSTLLNQEHARAERYQSPYAIVYCDLDFFKTYNDQNGHPAGDQLLREFAAIVKRCCRSTDYPTRYGGEEFAVICPGVSWEGAKTLAERIRSSVEANQFAFGDKQPGGKVTVSVGVASYPQDGSSSLQVLTSADRALYQSKHQGRNRITVAQAVTLAAPAAPVPIQAAKAAKAGRPRKKKAA